MCRIDLSFTLDDQEVSIVRPDMGSDAAMHAWMIHIVRQAMKSYADDIRTRATKKTDGAALLGRLSDAKLSGQGLMRLAGVLGKPQGQFSWDAMREDAYADKYGI